MYGSSHSFYAIRDARGRSVTDGEQNKIRRSAFECEKTKQKTKQKRVSACYTSHREYQVEDEEDVLDDAHPAGLHGGGGDRGPLLTPRREGQLATLCVAGGWRRAAGGRRRAEGGALAERLLLVRATHSLD